MKTLQNILSDQDVTLIINNALVQYTEWRQVIDTAMYYIFCKRADFAIYCNDTLLRADIQKHIKILYYERKNYATKNWRIRNWFQPMLAPNKQNNGDFCSN